jgi:anti-sigma factor RsiW
MTRCRENVRLQDFLDGELPPGEVVAFRAHLAGCRECAAEVASFQSLIATLEGAPLLAPRPELTARILEQVLPSRARHRRLVALGWSYAGALTACVGAVALWALQPGGNAQLETLSGQLSHRLLGAGLFVLNLLGASAVRLADGWSLFHAVGGRLAPLSRALGAVLAEPRIAFTFCAAAAACAVLLWWMRPRAGAAAREVRHVGVLGF